MQIDHPLFDLNYSQNDLMELDLSVDNVNLEKLNSQEELGEYIQAAIQAAGKKYAIGGYGENRQVYRRFAHFDTADSKRSIHLGIDFWAPAGTSVYCPLPAKVHSWAFNNHLGDYGGTLILEHPDVGLHSLYGHLALAELRDLTKGQKVKPGDLIARLGEYEENGHWPPHLHFQLIKDIGDYSGDYPGVVEKNDAERYLNNCPNPRSFF